MTNEQRRSKYVDRKVQGQLAARTLVHWMVFLLVCCAVSLGLQWVLNPLASMDENLRQMWATQGPVVLVALCLFPVFVKDTITFSHRFVGPIARLRSTLRDVAAGQSVPPVKLRPNDYWLEMADELNAVIAEVERLRTEVKTQGSSASHHAAEPASVS